MSGSSEREQLLRVNVYFITFRNLRMLPTGDRFDTERTGSNAIDSGPIFISYVPITDNVRKWSTLCTGYWPAEFKEHSYIGDHDLLQGGKAT